MTKEASFQEILEWSEKFNHKRAVLSEVNIKHIPDNMEEENTIGIKAVATINFPFEIATSKGKEINFKIETISSGGLWGIDANSSKEDLKEIEQEQREELLNYLNMLNVVIYIDVI